MGNYVEVVAALIYREDRFMICRRPEGKARANLWEFPGGKIERGETATAALARECREELGIEVSVGELFADVRHEYSDLSVHLSLFKCKIERGEPQLLEHSDIRWILSEEIREFAFCPADTVILKKISGAPLCRAAFFDLDGTLLPMDQDRFTKEYFKLLAAKLAPHGYPQKELIDGIWAGTAEMVQNNGAQTNEAAFWKKFSSIFGERVYEDEKIFEDFYRNDFNAARSACGFSAQSALLIQRLKREGYRTVLASNPIFPRVAQENRLRWAGLSPDDFLYITSYENSRYCKPNPDYYSEIMQKLGLQPSECLMIGNDVREDGAAAKVGIEVFLLTPCLINRENADYSQIAHGGFEELNAFLDRR